MTRGLVWFKKDLRIGDNSALFQASKECSEGIIAIYLIDRNMWKKNDVSEIQIQFILQGLSALKNDLAELNIPLIIKSVSTTKKISAEIHRIIEKYSVTKLYLNSELEINELRRDKEVIDYFVSKKIAVQAHQDQLILPYESVKTLQGDYFKVFTAFKNQWIKIFSQQAIKLLPKPSVGPKITVSADDDRPFEVPKSSIDLLSWPAGEAEAKKRLRHFTKNDLFDYNDHRDFPALDLTSKLSPYLATGMVSGKTCFLAALLANSNELTSGRKGALVWMSELIWREFYRHIIIAVPRVCMHKAYQIKTEKLPWSYQDHLLHAWQQGRTGFPIVDAGMRQLNTTGWMHNRLRMIVAMFLSKNLFLDWRLGEKYFSNRLIDVDFPSNNGGWQWSASTGTDAVPYFRIFNPTTQSERFDPEGTFIKKFCPELKKFDKKTIHDPYKYQPDLAKEVGYPKPIIHYPTSRQYAIAAFKNLV